MSAHNQEPAPGPKPAPRLRLGCVTDPGTKPGTVYCCYQWSPAWYTIHWGDMVRTPSRPELIEEHVYTKPGIYFVAIVYTGDSEPVATGQIRVRENLLPQVSLELGDDPRFTDLVYFKSDEPYAVDLGIQSYYDIDFGDDSPPKRRVLVEPQTRGPWHGYQAEGTYDVTVTDHSTRIVHTFQHVVEPPNYDPDFTVEYDPDDPDKMTVKLIVTKIRPSSEGDTKIHWDDESPVETVPGTVGTVLRHTYTSPDYYFLEMWYPGGGKYKRTTKYFVAGGEES